MSYASLDTAATAYFYLDKPENNLPPLASLTASATPPRQPGDDQFPCDAKSPCFEEGALDRR